MALLKDKTLGLDTRYTSFMSVEKLAADIVTSLIQNKRLVKLLYYCDRHALSAPDLNQEQIFGLLNKQIKTVPQLDLEDDIQPYIMISMDTFTPFENQTEFRNITFSIDIICPYSMWQLDDFKLRPYSIAGEVDAMVNKASRIKTSAGVADFVGAKQLILNNEIGGLSLYYSYEATYDDKTVNPVS